jgi:two-component system, OmpR family, sensor histidine kinase MprB
MPLRRRLALVAAAAVGVAILAVAIVSYVVVRGQLRSEVDDALKAQELRVEAIGPRALGGDLPGIPVGSGGPAPYSQVVASDGTVAHTGNTALPVDSSIRAIAAGKADVTLEDIHVSGTHLRMLAFSLPGGAIQLARPLGPVDHVLGQLRLILLLLCGGGIALAAALGRLAARRVLAPLAEVAKTAQRIGETDDLSHRIEIRADDEVGQLARRFNDMLEHLERSRAALDESVRAQRQLVADASHELRTPVTSLRTNIEVLLAGGELSDDDRHRLLTDVVEQSEELSALVGDLIELGRGDLPSGTAEDVRLDRVVEEATARARRNAPGIDFETTLQPVIVDGVPERLGRAINNLLDNAARHSPPGGTVEVVADAGGVLVRDHGPGVDPEDLPHVFDRFFRGANSRGRQGSGLGLAIVRQVAEQHGGSVSAANADDGAGGAIFRFELPTLPAEPADDESGREPAPEQQPATVA